MRRTALLDLGELLVNHGAGLLSGTPAAKIARHFDAPDDVVLLAETLDRATAGEGDPRPDERRVWTLAELLADPALLRAPDPVIPRLAWHQRVTVISAREKRGKTTFVAHGVAALSAGREHLGERTTKAKALWVYFEGHPGDIVRTFASAAADGENVIVARGTPGKPGELRELCGAVEPAVMVVDTLSSYAAGTVTEFSRAEQWTPVMNQFARVAQEMGVAVVLIHHNTKAGTGYADSRAIGAGADMLLNIPGEPDDPSPRREITGVGRWSFTGYTVRLEGDRFVLDDAGKPTVELKVLKFIRDNPGAGTTRLRRDIGGRAEDVDAAVYRLLKERLIEDRIQGLAHHFHAVDAGVNPESRPVPLSRENALGTGLGTGDLSDLSTLRDNELHDAGQPTCPTPPSVRMGVGRVSGNGTHPRHPCPGGCGVTFSAPIKRACEACRRRAEVAAS